MIKTANLLRIAAFVAMLLGVIAVSGLTGTAQQSYGWTPQQRIPDYYVDSLAPFLVADQNRTVHAFYTQPVDADSAGTQPASNLPLEEAIFYRQWTIEDGWTDPIDILLPPPRTAELVLGGVELDQRTGMFHLIFYAGDQFNAAIYYSRAPAVNADSASAWSAPKLVAEDAGPFAFAALASDDNGNLFIVYEGKVAGIGLYEVHSTDEGDTWSDAATVFLVYQPEQWATAIQLDVDPHGQLHSVWSVWSSAGHSDAIYYARLNAEHSRWSEPTLLAKRDAGDYEADWASIVDYEDELIVVYQDSFPTTRWMRRSRDSGETWSNPVRLFPHVGEHGSANFLVDSSGILHMFFGARTSDVILGMWHSTWLGGRWSAPEPVVSGPHTSQFAPTLPQSVISQGNTILVTWIKDTTVGPRNGVWYSYTTLDAPELPVVPLPIPSATPAPAMASSPTAPPVTPTPIPERLYSGDISPSTVDTMALNPALPLVIGVFPAVLLTVAIIVYRSYSHIRSRGT